jgi:acid phosphatase
MLSALELIPQTLDLPSDRVLNRTWRTSDVVPMGGRIIFERLACPAIQQCWDNSPFYPNHVYCEPARDDYHVRINVNDAIVPIPGCQDGPGRSCPLASFTKMVERLGAAAGEFRKVCGLGEDAAAAITFLHQ